MRDFQLDITDHPSPNFDERKAEISLIILHYTGMETGAAALERLCDVEAKVSAHYLVYEDGAIIRMVDEAQRAWHAGLSEWRGVTDINSASIGIETVNGGHNVPLEDGSLPPYPNAQINAVIALCKDIMARHDIPPQNILGHSDVAPMRKIDPGEHFPWAGLAAAGVGLWPDALPDDRRILFEPDSRDRGVAILQRGLAQIGYGARVTGVYDVDTQEIVKAVQRRFRPDHIDGLVDIQTMEIVKWWVEASG